MAACCTTCRRRPTGRRSRSDRADLPTSASAAAGRISCCRRARSLYGIAGPSAHARLAVGDSGTILRFDGTSVAARSVALWRTAARGLVVAGQSRDDRRQRGHRARMGRRRVACHRHAIRSAFLRHVWGTEWADVWAVGDSGTVLRYDGNAWHRLARRSNAAPARRLGPLAARCLGRRRLRHGAALGWPRVADAAAADRPTRCARCAASAATSSSSARTARRASGMARAWTSSTSGLPVLLLGLDVTRTGFIAVGEVSAIVEGTEGGASG